MATTINERILKFESDTRYAQYIAFRDAANIDYLAMMSDIEIPTEEGSNDE